MIGFFEYILEPIGIWTMDVIETMGYWGVVLLMAIESACIPLPSEIIMPFAGIIVAKGGMNLWMAGLAGAFGCLLGSIVAYAVGYWGGRPFVEKYGKYILISESELAWADRWFDKWGLWAVFISRLLPIIRTFISLPAGIGKVKFIPFCILSFVGSFPWCLGLAYVGLILGENSDIVLKYLHKFDIVIAILIVVGVGVWLYKHFKDAAKKKKEAA
ncbi:MAG: DedA family protein [bacterium]|nr:DedA family protein [bacterium]